MVHQIVSGFQSAAIITPCAGQLPSTLGESESIQDQVISGLGTISGWKIGASTAAVRTKFGFSRIFLGALPSSRVLKSPAIATLAHGQVGVECEFSFRLGRNLGPRRRPYNPQEIQDALAAVVPSIEIPETRFSAIGVHGPFALVADNGASGLLVVGKGQAFTGDPSRLLDYLVTLKINGVVTVKGTGSHIIGGPFGALVDFVNLATKRGHTIHAGDVVATGSCTGYFAVPAGSVAIADFGCVGEVAVTFSSAVRANP